MKAIGYIRVSTQGQADEGVSLEAQRAKIEAWCAANDYTLEAVFVDAGISGKAMGNRQGLSEALDAVGKGNALVSYSMSRVSRSTRDMLSLADLLEKKGADLVSVTERIDSTSAAGKMVFRMLAVLGEFERDLVSERTKAVLAHKKANSEVYSPVPFGYTAIEGRLEVVEREARLVAEIMQMREQGLTLRAIASEMNGRGIAGKQGGKWYASTVRHLINRQAA